MEETVLTIIAFVIIYFSGIAVGFVLGENSEADRMQRHMNRLWNMVELGDTE